MQVVLFKGTVLCGLRIFMFLPGSLRFAGIVRAMSLTLVFPCWQGVFLYCVKKYGQGVKAIPWGKHGSKSFNGPPLVTGGLLRFCAGVEQVSR